MGASTTHSPVGFTAWYRDVFNVSIAIYTVGRPTNDNLMECGRAQSDLIKVLIRYYAGKTAEETASLTTSGVRLEIRTQNISNSSLNRYSYSSLFCPRHNTLRITRYRTNHTYENFPDMQCCIATCWASVDVHSMHTADEA
jgi:hypothetical protein